MTVRSAGLVSASFAVGAGTTAPGVPWWGQLIMALVATALAYFGGAAREPAK